MSEPTRFVTSILFPTDFSAGSEPAFAHALAIAVSARASLSLLHAGHEKQASGDWRSFPGVRSTLERWGAIEPGSSRGAVVQDLAVDVSKIATRESNPLRAVVDFLEAHPADLLVLATEGRGGLPRWLHPSVAERVARKSRTVTLFVPKKGGRFIDPDSGETALRRILVPVDRDPDPRGSMAWAARAAACLAPNSVEIALVNVGGEFRPDPPAAEGVRWTTLSARGDVVDGIVGAARDFSADLIVMSTHGHDGVLDVLRGSVTEQVLRQAELPLLAVPVAY